MPRPKRTLAEADPNASASAPATKKASTGAASGKENQNYRSKSVVELVSILKERGLPHRGRKAELVQRLEDTTKTISRAGEAVMAGVTGESDAPASKETSDWDFITICRPWNDEVEEKQAKDENYDPDEDDEEDENPCGGGNCKCQKSPKDFPDWKWLITRKGLTMVANLRDEAMKRDQDAMGEYHYNDFSGYGFQEGVENHLVSFNKEYQKSKPDPVVLWQHIEGFAHLIPGDGPWYMSDDSEGILQTLRLIGHAVLATMKVLDSQDLLRPDSPVKDFSLVIGLLLAALMPWPSGHGEPEFLWAKTVIAKCKEKGIKLADAPFGVEENVKKFEDEQVEEEEDDDDDDDAGVPKWENIDWKKEYTSFIRNHGRGNSAEGIGGDFYDLTKTTKTKKRGGRPKKA